MSKEIINRVAQSALMTLNLEDFLPQEPVLLFDLKNFLFKGLIVREKEFRASLSETDWDQFTDESVAVFCSSEAIIPHWAFMLVATYLEQVRSQSFIGNQEEATKQILIQRIQNIEIENYADKRVVIKGCGKKSIDNTAYFEITKRLFPICKSIMYGEACSTVPISKRK